MQIALEKYNTSIDNNRYYDAHEDLEEWWFPRRKTKTDEVLFVKGLINAAVSFELVKKGKLNGAKKVWKNYEKYKIKFDLFKSEHKKNYAKTMLKIEKLAKEKNITC